MKLLFDANLSHELVPALGSVFPGSMHVREVGLRQASDAAVWEFAKQNDFAVITKDADFHQLSFLCGHPPKVIWIRLGNCATAQILAAIRQHTADIFRFKDDPESAILIIS